MCEVVRGELSFQGVILLPLVAEFDISLSSLSPPLSLYQ